MFRGIQFGKGIGICLTSVIIAPCLIAQPSASTGETNREAPAPVAAAPVNLSAYAPMTQTERLRDYFQHVFGPESVVRSAAGSGISQAMSTPGEWGQGAEGYGRRFANSYAGHIVQSTVMYGMGAALHEDNRYFRSGLTGFGPRLKYAILSTFLARHDDGNRYFSFSRMTSYVASAGISRAWQPPSASNVTHAADAFGIDIGAAAGFNVMREFVPGLFRSRPRVATSRHPAP